jgi:chlorophyllide a oxygenase
MCSYSSFVEKKRLGSEEVTLYVSNVFADRRKRPWLMELRVNALKRRQNTWNQIFHQVVRNCSEASAQSPRDYNFKVFNSFDDKFRDYRSTVDLRQELTKLREGLADAHDRIHDTEVKVEVNVRRIDKMKRMFGTIDTVHRPSMNPTDNTKNSVGSPFLTSVASSELSLKRKNMGLESSLDLETQLKEFWYPVEFSRTLAADTIIPLQLFDEPWVLFRQKDGQPSCIRDSCAHRACPLSLGKIEKGQISCAYHGWKFAGNGECTAMPSTVFMKGVSVAALPCVEIDGLVWVYLGEQTPPEIPYTITESPQGFDIHAELLLEVPVEHGLLIENLLDLAHAPFTHKSTFAKGWPVPDLVAFKTVEMLGGHWHPYPIDMSFAPPCTTLSTIGLSQPGKIEKGQRQEDCRNHLHQLHVCIPAGKGKTRLLYRMSLDFVPWARGLPFMDRLWRRVADQVLNEDLRLVLGQQECLLREGPRVTWANPVPYDKLAVRYRRWRNNLKQMKSEKRTRKIRSKDFIESDSS